MLNIFPSLTSQPLNTWVAFTATGNKLSISDLNLSDVFTRFYKNSELKTGDFELEEADILRVETLSPNSYSCPKFIYFKANSQLVVVGLSTIDDPSLRFNPYYATKTYLDQLTSTDGQNVLLEADRNAYSVYSKDGSLITTISLNSEPVNESCDNYTYLLEPKSPFINKINLESYRLIKKLEVNAPCLGLSHTKIPMTANRCAWLTLANGQVICLNQNDEVIQTFQLDGVGYGIDSSADGQMVAIADGQANQLTILEWIGTSWTKTSVSCGILPYDVYVDYGKNVWTSSKVGSKVYVYDYGRVVPATIEVGKGQKTIKQIDYTTLGIVCTETDEFLTIDLYTRKIKSRRTISPSPIDFCVLDGLLYVATADHCIYRLDSDKVTKLADCPATLYALESDSDRSTIYAISLYYNTPSLLYQPDRKSKDFVLDNPPVLYANSLYRSDSIQVKDITGELYYGIPNIFNMEVAIDGRLVDKIVQVNPGANLNFRFRVGIEKELVTFPVYLGNNLRYFESEVVASLTQPHAFIFDDVISADPGQTYSSNTITIQGLDQAELLFCDSGEIWLNNRQVASPCSVNNGDQVYLKNTASSTWGETKSSTVFLLGYTEVWSVNTKSDLLAYVLDKSLLGLPLYFSGISLGSRELLSLYQVDTQNLTTVDLALLSPTQVLPTSPLYVASSSYLYCVAIDNGSLAYKQSLSTVPAQVAASNQKVIVSYPLTNTVSCYSLDLSEHASLTAPTPYGLAVYGNLLWVACGPSGLVYLYDYESVSDQYVKQEEFNLNGFIYDIKYDATTGILYCTDILNKKVKRIQAKTIIESYDVGANPYSFTLVSQGLYVANTYDNTVTKIIDGVATSSETNCPVHALVTLDEPYFINLENSTVYKGSSLAPVFSTSLQNSHLQVVNRTLCVAHFYDQLFNLLKVTGNCKSTDFLSQEGLVPNSLVESNEIQFSELARPALVKAEGFPEIALIKNGELYGTQVEVNEGDYLKIQTKASPLYDTVSNIRIYAGDYNKLFVIKTKENTVPKFIKFQAIYNALTSFLVSSDERLIEGLSATASVPIEVEDPTVILFLNGVKHEEATCYVSNGDRIRLEWVVEMLYSSVKTLRLFSAGEHFASFNVYTENLLGPTSYSPFCNFTELANTNSPTCIQYRVELDYVSRSSHYRPTQDYTVELESSLTTKHDYTQDLVYKLESTNHYSVDLSYRLVGTTHYSLNLEYQLASSVDSSLRRKYSLVSSTLFSSDLSYTSSLFSDFHLAQDYLPLRTAEQEVSRDYELVTSNTPSLATQSQVLEGSIASLTRLTSYQTSFSFSLPSAYTPLTTRHQTVSSLFSFIQNANYSIPASYWTESAFSILTPSQPFYPKPIDLYCPTTIQVVPISYTRFSAEPSSIGENPLYQALSAILNNSVDDIAFLTGVPLPSLGLDVHLTGIALPSIGVESRLTGVPLPPLGLNGYLLGIPLPSLGIEGLNQAEPSKISDWSVKTDGFTFGPQYLSVQGRYYSQDGQFSVSSATVPAQYQQLVNAQLQAAVLIELGFVLPNPVTVIVPVLVSPSICTLNSQAFKDKVSATTLPMQVSTVGPYSFAYNLAQAVVNSGLRDTPLTSVYRIDVPVTTHLGSEYLVSSLASNQLNASFWLTHSSSLNKQIEFITGSAQNYALLSQYSSYLSLHYAANNLAVSDYRLAIEGQRTEILSFTSSSYPLPILPPFIFKINPALYKGKIRAIQESRWVTDQSQWGPDKKGSLTLSQALAEAERDPSLLVTKLPDGTYLYSYAPDNAYGECVKNKYCITHGFVKGG